MNSKYSWKCYCLLTSIFIGFVVVTSVVFLSKFLRLGLDPEGNYFSRLQRDSDIEDYHGMVTDHIDAKNIEENLK